MARTFEEQVEGLTGLSIDGSSAPNWNELGQFLKDGVKDVTNKVIGLMPNKKIFFSKVGTDTGGGVIITGDVLSVTRNNGTSDLPCARISSNLVGLISDSTSMHYKSAHNPAWYIKENVVKVVPIATVSNTASVEYIGYDNNITENNLTIQYMPEEYHYLVVMYAGIKSLENNLSSIALTLPASPLMNAPDWADTNTWISTEEDSEMLTSRVQEIQAKVAEFTARVQDLQAEGTLEVQKITSDYTRVHERLKMLAGQYQASFASMMAPKAPRQGKA